MREIHVAGAYGAKEIVEYNRSQTRISWTFPRYFPLREICPPLLLCLASEVKPHKDAILLVVNLNGKTWDFLQERLPLYGRTVLLQMEGRHDQEWEIAYQQCSAFDYFLNFDRTYSWHSGFRRVFLPYDPSLASSYHDQRGLSAIVSQWRNSKQHFMEFYLGRFLPRKPKAVMIASLPQQARYQNRLEAARKWKEWVDVYGGGWPDNLPNYHGNCVSKIATLPRYRYGLVFENQQQPGYVTEKLLDCFVAGTVPIYWGAPDVGEVVPAEAMIVMNENTPVEKYVQDIHQYKQHRAALLCSRGQVLSTYGKVGFMDTLREVLST